MTGSVRSDGRSFSTTSWQAAFLTVTGKRSARSFSFGNILILSRRDVGVRPSSRASIRSPNASSESTCKASFILFREPSALMRTGVSNPSGRSNRSAGPPPGDFETRSVTALISRSTLTGSRTRTSSRRASRRSRKARRSACAKTLSSGPASRGRLAAGHLRRRLEDEGHHAQPQLVAADDRSGSADREALAVDKRAVQRSHLLEEQEDPVLQDDAGVAPGDRTVDVDLGEINLGSRAGHGVVAADEGRFGCDGEVSRPTLEDQECEGAFRDLHLADRLGSRLYAGSGGRGGGRGWGLGRLVPCAGSHARRSGGRLPRGGRARQELDLSGCPPQPVAPPSGAAHGGLDGWAGHPIERGA